MTRKKYRNMTATLIDKVYMLRGEHLNGKNLRFYRTRDLTNIKAKSYAEAWESFRVLREMVGM